MVVARSEKHITRRSKMKMRKWLVLVALLVGAVSAQATVFYWAGDWFQPAGDGEWTTAANWYDTTIGAALAPPGAAEHVIIDEVVAAQTVGNPTLSSAGGTVNILTLGWGCGYGNPDHDRWCVA